MRHWERPSTRMHTEGKKENMSIVTCKVGQSDRMGGILLNFFGFVTAG